MHRAYLPVYLLILISFGNNFDAAYATSRLRWAGGGLLGMERSQPIPPRAPRHNTKRQVNTNADGSTYLWLQEDEYSGQTFFDRWNFYDQADPTHGHVNYVNKSDAFTKGLVYVAQNGTVIMKGDDTTYLNNGVYRDSVRVSSQAVYDMGLFILDLNRAPWGCGVWPAFWTLGTGNWPETGEIDIIEGVHDNEHNQVTWHTEPGCYLTTPSSYFTGTVLGQNGQNGQNGTDCNALINDNAGCAVVEWSRASYGPYFDAQGGGVFAMKWDETGVAVWSFYRAAVPQDIVQGSPDPSNWGQPVAELWSSGCNPLNYFANHSIVFDITFCGDWAGNSYATSGCPGTCDERLMDPNNFVNASWSINSLKVYKKQLFYGRNSGASGRRIRPMQFVVAMFMTSLTLYTLA
ncbi:hypothetical protein AX15_004822 [Amanita polypyramis BW_CC]|nr:hypothetical protein AX15_004822 [Amanita polypyramis BW_CC]